MMERPITLYLARHGNTFEKDETPRQIGARTDLVLTEKGRVQAMAVANFLHHKQAQVMAIYSSSLLRQAESAQIIAQAVKPTPKLFLNTQSLNELDYGKWEGLTADEISKKWPSQYQEWNDSGIWPDAIFEEKQAEVLDRIGTFLNYLRQTYPSGSNVLAITSNGILRMLCTLADKQPSTVVADRRVATGAICELQLFKDTFSIVSWNIKPT